MGSLQHSLLFWMAWFAFCIQWKHTVEMVEMGPQFHFCWGFICYYFCRVRCTLHDQKCGCLMFHQRQLGGWAYVSAQLHECVDAFKFSPVPESAMVFRCWFIKEGIAHREGLSFSCPGGRLEGRRRQWGRAEFNSFIKLDFREARGGWEEQSANESAKE